MTKHSQVALVPHAVPPGARYACRTFSPHMACIYVLAPPLDTNIEVNHSTALTLSGLVSGLLCGLIELERIQISLATVGQQQLEFSVVARILQRDGRNNEYSTK
jgi:hypothetical protein